MTETKGYYYFIDDDTIAYSSLFKNAKEACLFRDENWPNADVAVRVLG